MFADLKLDFAMAQKPVGLTTVNDSLGTTI